MKRGFVISFLIAFSFTSIGQNCTSYRYLSNIFQSSVSQDVVFGNSPALTTIYVAENVTVDQDMTMDIFFPVGDNLPKRPLVMLAYGGGYLFGTKEDEDVWTTCDSLAKKGYVTASINYRMNLNAASQSSSVRAMYRAAQDYSSALRYLKENADLYGIDTNYIFVGGVSAGGFSAMHMAFMDENERPAATFQSGIGGIDPDLGCMSCAGNNFQHTNDVRGIINLWGALLDTAFVQQDEVVPMTLFHGTADLIVPYENGLPFTALLTMPAIHGSANIAQRISNLGGNPELNLFDGVGHNIWGLNVNNVMVGGPTEHWSPITDSIVSFLYENIRPPQPIVVVEENVCLNDTVVLHVSNIPINGRACWEIENATIISSSQDSSEITVVWETPGNYAVSVTVFNHLETSSIIFSTEIAVNELPVVSISNNGNQIEASGVYPFYQWYLDGTFLPGENEPTLTPTTFGSYTVEAVNQFGCTAFSEESVLVGINEALSGNIGVHSVSVHDIYGRRLASMSVRSWLNSHENRGQGIYLITFYDKYGTLLYRRRSVQVLK